MKKIFSAALLPCLLLASAAHGQGLKIMPGATFKTTGNVAIVSESGNIINDGNGDFSAANIYFKGTGITAFGGTSALSVQNFTIVRAKGKTILQNNMSVAGQVILQSGVLDLNGKNINLSTSGSISGETETNRIIDELGGQIIISVHLNGPLAANPGNLGAIITSAANLGTVVIKRGHLPQATGHPNGSVLRYYDITPSNNTSLGAIFRFSYLDAELNGLPEPNLRLYKSTDGGANWSNEGFSGKSAAADYVDLSGVNSFPRWTLSTPASALPVQLIGFTAQCNGSTVQLSWKTAQEINSKRFVVERSINGLDWQVIGTVPAQGNSATGVAYSYKDPSAPFVRNYYRLLEEDLDGRSVYSPVSTVDPCSINSFQLKLSPVPVMNTGILSVQADANNTSEIKIFNAEGKEVFRQLVQLNTGSNQVSLNLSRLSKGYYYLSVDSRPAGKKGISFIKL